MALSDKNTERDQSCCRLKGLQPESTCYWAVGAQDPCLLPQPESCAGSRRGARACDPTGRGGLKPSNREMAPGLGGSGVADSTRPARRSPCRQPGGGSGAMNGSNRANPRTGFTAARETDQSDPRHGVGEGTQPVNCEHRPGAEPRGVSNRLGSATICCTERAVPNRTQWGERGR